MINSNFSAGLAKLFNIARYADSQRFLKLAVIAFVLLLSLPIGHAANTLNATLLYGTNGTAPVALLTDGTGTLQTDINFSLAVGLNPKANNTHSLGSSSKQWSTLFTTNVRSAGDLLLYAGGTERITVKAGGNVGINNTNPQQTLSVTGQTNASGTLILNGTTVIRGVLYNWPSADGSANQVLTTDAAGGLSWATVGGASSNISARNITAGTFGASVGNGDYSFPANISVSQNISASGRISDKTGFLTPVGMIVLYSGALAPAGWLIANGSEVNRTTYPDLFNITGTIYGNTTDSTFKLPDLRQRIALGKADSGTGSTLGGTGGAIDHTHTGPSHTHAFSTMIAHTHAVDPGSTASDSQGSHSHSASTGSEAVHTHAIDPPSTASDSQGSHTHTITIESRSENGADEAFNNPFAGAGTGTTNSGGAHTHSTDIASFTSGAGSSHSHSISSDNAHTHSTDIASFTSGSTGSASGTSDAGGTGATGTGNPPFIALYYIIKY